MSPVHWRQWDCLLFKCISKLIAVYLFKYSCKGRFLKQRGYFDVKTSPLLPFSAKLGPHGRMHGRKAGRKTSLYFELWNRHSYCRKIFLEDNFREFCLRISLENIWIRNNNLGVSINNIWGSFGGGNGKSGWSKAKFYFGDSLPFSGLLMAVAAIEVKTSKLTLPI